MEKYYFIRDIWDKFILYDVGNSISWSGTEEFYQKISFFRFQKKYKKLL